MKRAVITVAAVCAAAGAAFIAGALPRATTSFSPSAISLAAAAEAGAMIYYQDPDGKPFYSLAPKKTPDGRNWRGVPASADVSFGEPEEPPTESKSAAAKTERKIKYYRNPMGLPDTSPIPKKDSMGMNYIPVYEGEDTDDGSIKLSPGKIQRTGVKSEPVKRRSIHVLVKAPGTIDLDERRVSVITMRAESFIQKVADVTTGTRVSAGQPLMEIYSPAVSSAAAEYLATLDSKTTGGVQFYGRGSRQRLMNLDVPEPVIVEMEKTHTASITIPWFAPHDGIVLERNAVEGMRANPGDVLFRIADISVIWALVDVAERDLGSIAVGQPVTLHARSFPGRIFSGTIAVVYPQVNRKTRTARVRVDLANPDFALLPDMYVDAEIETGAPGPVLAVPENAVLDSGARQVVLIDKGEGRFEPREVKVGRRGGGYVEVTQGLSEGEAIVTSANFLIDAESNLKAALQGFAEASDPQANEPARGAEARP